MATTRRDFIAAALGASASAALLPGSALAQQQPLASASASRVLRFAHITDTHIQPERKAAEGVAAMLQHISAQADKPDFVLHTGDIIMDAFAEDRDRTTLQWKLWTDAVKNHLSLPIHYAIGNHDIWGWSKEKAGAKGDEPDFGKKWACDVLGLAKPHHAFEVPTKSGPSGWKFIALDSVSPYRSSGYMAKLDDAQFDWLSNELASTPASTNICIASHIPIFSVAAYNWSNTDKPTTRPAQETDSPARIFVRERGDVLLQGNLVHSDFRRLKDLFAKYPNVKIAIAGHLHLLDSCSYNGVTYMCNGAASAGWWSGVHMNECDFGYALIDLYPDGSFSRQYVPYGWTAQPK